MGNCCASLIKAESPLKGVTSSDLERPHKSEYLNEQLRAGSELANHKIPSVPNLAREGRITELPPCMMMEIFSRLPVKSVSRFRAGCKLWNSLTNDHYFAYLQFKNGSDRNKPVVITFYTDFKLGIFLHQYKAGSPLYQKFHLKYTNFLPYLCYSMTNSCNGLICILGLETAFLVNVTTAESVALPNGTRHYGKSSFSMAPAASGGIVYDIYKAKYNIVRLFLHVDMGTLHLGCEILTLGSISWRRICLKKLDSGDEYTIVGQAPVLIDDNLYWTATPFPPGPVVAVAFETKNETIDFIQHPEGAVVAGLWSSAIGNLSGYLCLGDIKFDGNGNTGRYYLNIWVLVDYKQRRWMKHCTIEENPVPRAVGFRIQAILDGTVILSASGWKMFSIDVKGPQQLWKVEDIFFDDCIFCVESLISPVACHNQSQTMTSGERVCEVHPREKPSNSVVCVDCKCLDAKFSAGHPKLHNIVL